MEKVKRSKKQNLIRFTIVLLLLAILFFYSLVKLLEFKKHSGSISYEISQNIMVMRIRENNKNERLLGKIKSIRRNNEYIMYDKKRNKIEEKEYGIRLTYKYNKNSNLIEKIYCPDIDKEYNIKFTYKYDERANLIEKKCFHYDIKTLIFRWTYKYDSRDNKIEEKRYDYYGILEHHFTYKYEYDKTGNWIKKSEFCDGALKDTVERKIEYYE